MNPHNFLKANSPWANVVKGGLLFFLCSLVACGGGKKPEANKPEETRQESRLFLNNATLEQSNPKGQLVWKIQVDEAAYTPDRHKAQLTGVKGNLFQDGKIVLQIKSDEGEIYRDGVEIFLRKNIVALDPRNKTVIRSNEVEWRPQDSVLIVRKNLRGSHPDLEASAKEGKYYTRKEQLELTGNIVATAKNPRLQLKTEYLQWDVSQDKLKGDRLFNLVRFQDKTVTDRLVGKKLEVRFKTKEVIIEDNIDFKSIKPPIQVATKQVIWQYKNRQVRSDKPIQLINYVDGVSITANQAQVDFSQQIAYLKGGVQGTNASNQGKLYANDITWNMGTRIVEALGNVIYEQANPKFNLTGEKAVGTLHDNKIMVSGNNQERVVTEIFPD
ncbi:LPS export ABC transporter periplasmic protein LptC [Aphanothece sacrum]|uniref:Homoserine dehydrogenase n=1 Tax=Aphanothece sacrum FPU1 TaxID=1920663 RepID=A0A401IGB5_APHSA|nr:LPS export ABC transporter periplasmic protein LptC [Aphanothece sacrum]GBF80332.1 homoserine dehydrogenase [Aphanothece sacrum FPU1]GBF83739.1 homoserine dehydrogenase [Aphanothece sacrum FPU3]